MAEQCPYCGCEDFDLLDDGTFKCICCGEVLLDLEYFDDDW